MYKKFANSGKLKGNKEFSMTFKAAVSVIFTLMITSCSGTPARSSDPVQTAPAAEAPADSGGSSEVLREGKKCPKHATLVKGKCMLDVESDD